MAGGRLLALPAAAAAVVAASVAWALLHEQQLEREAAAGRVAPLPAGEFAAADPEGAVARLSGALAIKTVANWSAPNHVSEEAPFREFHAFLADAFPSVWQALDVETVSTHSLVLTWAGRNATAPPGLLLSHFDVVPVDPLDEPAWAQPPFAGRVAGGFVWGRGALDTKISLLGILEAVRDLLAEGFQPERTLILAFGHDEEVGGQHGAAAIVRHLQARGVHKAAFVLDEGGAVMLEGFRPFTAKPVAVIGTAEKGMANIEMEVTTKGGHASMPPLDGSSVGSIVSRVLGRIDRAPINPAMLPPTGDLLRAMAPEAPLLLRPLLRNVGNPVLGKLVAQVMGAVSPEASSMTRTTVATTVVKSGVAQNVLPQYAFVNFNARIMPGETRQEALHYINITGVANDAPFVKLAMTMQGQDPSPVSDCRGAVFARIAQAALETLQDPEIGMMAAPYLVMGGTDSRYYAELTPEVFRFSPIMINKTAGDLGRIHGNDERVAVADYLKAIRFFKRFMTLSSAL